MKIDLDFGEESLPELGDLMYGEHGHTMLLIKNPFSGMYSLLNTEDCLFVLTGYPSIEEIMEAYGDYVIMADADTLTLTNRQE